MKSIGNLKRSIPVNKAMSHITVEKYYTIILLRMLISLLEYSCNLLRIIQKIFAIVLFQTVDFNRKLTLVLITNISHNKSRRGNIIWLNPPCSNNVSSNIGNNF